MATVTLLRRLGCSVEFRPQQTCCGQPAFNTGYRPEARALAQRTIELFERDPADAIVCPSGSCTAMLHHYEDLFEDAHWRTRARVLAERSFELSAFLVHRLQVVDVGATFKARLTWHDACHGLRDLGLRDEPRQLLRQVKGAELVEAENAQVCCGFGGTFSVKYPEISVAMVDQKIAGIESARVDAVVSGDASCLMQIGGRLARMNSPTRVLHLAEVLAAT